MRAECKYDPSGTDYRGFFRTEQAETMQRLAPQFGVSVDVVEAGPAGIYTIEYHREGASLGQEVVTVSQGLVCLRIRSESGNLTPFWVAVDKAEAVLSEK